MTVSGTFVSFASSTIVAAPPGTDWAMGVYKKVAGLMVNDRPVYKGAENGLYLCYGVFNHPTVFRGWMISSKSCTALISHVVQPHGTPDALCPDQVAEFLLWIYGVLSFSHRVSIKQGTGTYPLKSP